MTADRKAAPTADPFDGFALGRAVLAVAGAERAAALAAITARGEVDMLASLILAMRYAPGPDLDAAAAAVTGDPAPPGWFAWMLWQEGRPDIVPQESHAELKRLILEWLDPAFLRFLGPERTRRDRIRIRLEEIVWGGVRVDGIPALDDPVRVPPSEARYLNDDDLVFGVSIGDDARAYPLRIMGWHEMFNETIGGVPVALACCTLCGAGIFFETQAEGREKPFVFGSSGLLHRKLSK